MESSNHFYFKIQIEEYNRDYIFTESVFLEVFFNFKFNDLCELKQERDSF